MIESKGKTKNISSHATAIESLRDAGFSMKVKSRNGNELPVSFFRKARLDFHAQRADQKESHMLTAMTYLVFLANQNEPSTMIHSPPRARMLPKPANPVDKNVEDKQKDIDDERHAGLSHKFNLKAAEFVPLASYLVDGADGKFNRTRTSNKPSLEFKQESQSVKCVPSERDDLLHFDQQWNKFGLSEWKSHNKNECTGVSAREKVDRSRSFNDFQHRTTAKRATHSEYRTRWKPHHSYLPEETHYMVPSKSSLLASSE